MTKTRSATAPLTGRRAGALIAFGTLVVVGIGVGVGQWAGRRSLFGFDGATWTTAAVTVRVSGGSKVSAAIAVVAALGLFALLADWSWTLVRTRLDPPPSRRRHWQRAIAAMWAAGALATMGGVATTGRDDGASGGWVAGNLLDAGDDVAAELTSGYAEVPQPGGAGVSRSIRLPAVIEYEVDGRSCTVVVDNELDVVDDTITLIPRCSG